MFNEENPLATWGSKTKDKYQGLWRGRVEYNKDPLQQGRTKIRVFELHGIEYEELNGTTHHGTPTRALPWARPMWGFGGGGGAHDAGTFDVPPVGANVWVMFEKSDPNFPVYLGTFYDITVSERKYGTVRSDYEDRELPLQLPSMGTWTCPPGAQMPIESQEMDDHDPTVHVLMKTPKGATILVEERDGLERLEILDRLGQGLRFESPVTVEHNEGNAERRGQRSVFRGDQASRDIVEGKRTLVGLADILNQGLLIDSKEGSERVQLISNTEEGAPAFGVGPTREEITISAGHNKTLIRGLVDGVIKYSIICNSISGVIEVSSENDVIVKTKGVLIEAAENGIVLQGDVKIQGDLSVSGKVGIGGTTTCTGHLTAAAGCTGCCSGC